MLDLDLIRIDGGTQSRVELNQETVAEYCEAYKAGANMPPVIVFYDGTDRWLADGFHRYFGAKAAGLTQIYENITPGTLRDAVLYSLRANATHGLKRSNADKRKAVETMLKDGEWAAWSDRKIAEVCGVGNQLVGDVRRAICVNHTDAPVTRKVERNGTSYEQKIASSAAPKPAKFQGKPKKVLATKWIAAEIKAAESKKEAESADARVESLQQEVLALRETLAAAQDDIVSMAQVLDAGDQLVAAIAEAKSARDLARGLQQRINSMMTEIADLKRSVKYWEKKAGQPA
jgi:hypothetical protein